MSHWKELRTARLRSSFCKTSSTLMSSPFRSWPNPQVFLVVPARNTGPLPLESDEPRVTAVAGMAAVFISTGDVFAVGRPLAALSRGGGGENDGVFLFRPNRSCSICLRSRPNRPSPALGDGSSFIASTWLAVLTSFLSVSLSLSRLIASRAVCPAPPVLEPRSDKAMARFKSSSWSKDAMAINICNQGWREFRLALQRSGGC